ELATIYVLHPPDESTVSRRAARACPRIVGGWGARCSALRGLLSAENSLRPLPRELPMRRAVVCLVAMLFVPAALRAGEPPLVEKFLTDGRLIDGERALDAHLKVHP